MVARPHRWLERLTVELSDTNRSPVGEGSEVSGVFRDREVWGMLEKKMARGHGGHRKIDN